MDSNDAVDKLEVAVDLVKESQRQDDVNTEDDGIIFTPKQVRQMMKSFELYDDNADKKLNIDELEKALRVVGQNPTRKQLQEIFEEADRDGNEGIDQEEFTRLLIRNMQKEEDVKRELREAFAAFDSSGKGRVKQQDLIDTLKLCGDEPLTDSEADHMLAVMDKDADGYIEIDEFVNYLCRAIPPRYYIDAS